MATATELPTYIEARERYLRALGKYEAQEKRLFELFGVNNSADLEVMMLAKRHEHIEERQKFVVLTNQLDRLADEYDLAQQRQRQKIAAQQKQFHKIIANLDE